MEHTKIKSMRHSRIKSLTESDAELISRIWYSQLGFKVSDILRINSMNCIDEILFNILTLDIRNSMERLR